jgi:hypothetical protein
MVSLSSCETEYIAIWFGFVLKELMAEVKKSIKLLIDNKSAINLANNPLLHGRSEHIGVIFYFLREQVNNGRLKVMHCPTESQIADALTNVAKVDGFLLLRDELGVIQFDE